MPRNRKQGGRSGPSQRQLRVGELIRHALAELFAKGEIRDPGLDGISLTVTEVAVTRDLGHAKAYVVPLAGADKEATLKALGRCRSFIRGRLGHMVELRHVPEIDFFLDTSFDNYAQVSSLLASERVRRDLEPGEDN
ncbi:MAG: 30S ribosome-binding factor RbfA [Rhizobiales bacterium]|nr:30S ribosome-binding factor RbfA [Hyphomicrobiales bacterium]